MKLPWYIKQESLKTNDKGKLIATFHFNKWWIRLQHVKVFFKELKNVKIHV